MSPSENLVSPRRLPSQDNPSPNTYPQYLPDSQINATPSPNSSHGTPHSAPGDIEPSSSSRPTMPVRSRTATAPGDLVRSESTNTAKGGCWTCRVRRKKCDEERHGDSCKTCKRLQIECLGWGSRRPEWMRDKAEVDAYKAGIKAQLASRGMIRGQPKMQTVPIVPSVPAIPSMSSAATYGSNVRSADIGTERSTAMADYHHTYNVGPTGALYHETLIPTGLPGDPSVNINVFDMPTTVAHSSSLFAPFTTSPTSSPQQAFEYDPHVQTAFTASSRLEESALRESHVFYYFQRVRQLQFPFAGAAMTDAVHDLIVQNPFGAVGNAICSLASLHNSRMHNPVSTEVDERAHQFYQEAYLQLAESHRQNGAWTELDATAAIHFISFWVMAGTGDWSQPLGIACEWLSQLTGLHSGENPKMSMLKLTETARFAAKATMWMDIFASISLPQPPKFMMLYRRLFGSAGGFWGHGASDGQDLRMETLMGCPDEVLLAIAEISALEHWKEQEKRHRRLSTRELVRRGDDIERLLQQPTNFSTDPFGSASGPSGSGGRHSPYSSGHNTPELGINVTNSLAATNASGLASTMVPDIRQIVANIFREAASLYLFVVVNDAANPVIPEIRSAVRSTIRSLSDLPPSDLDRALVFPILLTACLTDEATERQFLRHRLQERHQGVGNVHQVIQLMDAVWQRRDTHGGPVDWRRIMHEMGLNILLV